MINFLIIITEKKDQKLYQKIIFKKTKSCFKDQILWKRAKLNR
jgi:hypothetical protein